MNASITLGAIPTPDGVRFTVWAPHAQAVDVVLEDQPGQDISLQKSTDGFFEGLHPLAGAGSLYRYRVDNHGLYPDPVSRFQPQGVHGPSQVVDPESFTWSDRTWRGIELKDLTLYELHVGTFTPQGTFAGVVERLPYLADLGITALELMPVADFSGSRNWGYDGVSLFAPSHSYGTPDDLRTLVNRAHALGLAVILDVVYNHLGPDGNYLNAFSPFYFTARHKTPWGPAVNLDSEHSDQARAFFIQNAQHWVTHYHMDGLRFDATHAMIDESPRPFLAELTDQVRASEPGRKVLLIAEDCRNLSQMIKPEKEGGWGMDGVWADDFHHQVRRSLAGDHEGYFEDFSGSLADLAATIRHGWFFHGQHAAHFGGPRGTDPAGLPLERFVVCIQNHDQVGNRALGERLNHQIDPPSYRAASALLLSVPETPLLFMGQEWGAQSPFLFFTDHHDELGKLVTEGRRGEFKSFSAFSDPAARAKIPDPQNPSTFESSRLQWSELEYAPHAYLRKLYRCLLSWRKKNVLSSSNSDRFTVLAANSALILEYLRSEQNRTWVIIQWRGAGRHEFAIPEKASWKLVLTTEDPDLAADPKPIDVRQKNSRLAVTFQRPGAIFIDLQPASLKP